MRLMHILDFFNVFGAVLKKFPSIEGLVFKAVLNNNTIGNHQNKPSEIVGRNNVCSLGDFCRNKLLEFIIAMNQLSSDFLVAEQCRVKKVKPEPGIGLYFSRLHSLQDGAARYPFPCFPSIVSARPIGAKDSGR